MNTFDIFADSGCNIPDALVKKHGIGVVPYLITVNGVDKLCYENDIPFDELAKAFYADLRAGAEVKTSLIGEARFEEAVTPSLKAGKDVLLFTISSGISRRLPQKRSWKRSSPTTRFTLSIRRTLQWVLAL